MGVKKIKQWNMRERGGTRERATWGLWIWDARVGETILNLRRKEWVYGFGEWAKEEFQKS